MPRLRRQIQKGQRRGRTESAKEDRTPESVSRFLIRQATCAARIHLCTSEVSVFAFYWKRFWKRLNEFCFLLFCFSSLCLSYLTSNFMPYQKKRKKNHIAGIVKKILLKYNSAHFSRVQQFVLAHAISPLLK